MDRDARDALRKSLNETAVGHNLAVVLRHMKEAGLKEIEVGFEGRWDEENWHTLEGEPSSADPEDEVRGIRHVCNREWTPSLAELDPMEFWDAVGFLCDELLWHEKPGWNRFEGSSGTIHIGEGGYTLELEMTSSGEKVVVTREPKEFLPGPGADGPGRG